MLTISAEWLTAREVQHVHEPLQGWGYMEDVFSLSPELYK